ncbi:hypothetical protein DPMN_046100 [Dreissena polymorpha]|uniref:Uncharacterized protein n=1 Tax=Dreissena polymorpha TaxID=45954 RepID=A0A9D4I0A7_DREPO|nr:hypothetical protein DPMN_046100 [Dreissena polymorpha]
MMLVSAINTSIDRKLFNLRSLCAKNKDTISDVMFANDCGLNTVSEADMQRCVDMFSCTTLVLLSAQKRRTSSISPRQDSLTFSPIFLSVVRDSKQWIASFILVADYDSMSPLIIKCKAA